MITPAKLRTRWIECLDSDDPNSIRHQVVVLLYHASVYRSILHAINMMPKVEDHVMVNATYHRFIDQSFWVTQIAFVRKLVDKQSLVHASNGGNKRQEDRSVWSFISLIRDMKKHRGEYFTRKRMMDVEGIEYDIDTVARREQQLDSKMIARNTESYAIPRDCDPEVPFRRHAQLDEICSIEASRRQPSDAVPIDLFDALERKLTAATESIVVIAHKHTLHAATPTSRKTDAYTAGQVILLKELQTAHEAIVKTFRFISVYLLGHHDMSFSIDPYSGMFDHHDSGIGPSGSSQQLWEHWTTLQAEIAGHKEWTVQELLEVN
jgi:hypothetical protein